MADTGNGNGNNNGIGTKSESRLSKQSSPGRRQSISAQQQHQQRRQQRQQEQQEQQHQQRQQQPRQQYQQIQQQQQYQKQQVAGHPVTAAAAVQPIFTAEEMSKVIKKQSISFGVFLLFQTETKGTGMQRKSSKPACTLNRLPRTVRL